MDGKIPPSKKSVTVTVASDREPVECSGIYSERGDGFTLEFIMEREKFVIEHSAAVTRVSTDGVMNYAIDIGDAATKTLLVTPYGNTEFDVKPLERVVSRADDCLRVVLKYMLSSPTMGEILRSVDITAR